MTSSLTDPERPLIEGCPDFDRSAAPPPAELLAQFAPYCRRLIRRYGTTPELRQDLVGEIYCIIHDLIEAYDHTRGVPFSAYIFKQLRACVFSRARREWQVQSREISTCPLDEDWWEMQQATSESLPDQVSLREWLREAIGRLTERQRAVVYLRYFQGREFGDIADALQIQPATARSLLRNGINQLRVILREEVRREQELECLEHLIGTGTEPNRGPVGRGRTQPAAGKLTRRSPTSR